MEFNQLLSARHSCREFSSKSVDPNTLGLILKASGSAPSAGNLQSYKIYLVRTQEIKEGIMNASYDQHFLAQVPALLVFCADTNTEGKYGERGASLYSVQDATIAAAYAQLAATDLGLSSVWVGAFDPLEVSRLVNALSYEVPVAIIAVGYSDSEPEATPRKLLDELVKEV